MNPRTDSRTNPRADAHTNPRANAALILAALIKDGRSLSALLTPKASGGSPPKGKSLKLSDQALVQELCYGVCRWYHNLAPSVTTLLKKPLKPKDTDIQCLLLMGLYQLQFMKIPAHAAINETVAAGRVLGKPWASGLINAVLRGFQRQQKQLPEPESEQQRWSHPKWLLNELRNAWPNHWQQICEANNSRAPMTLRVNRQYCTRAAYLDLLTAENIAAVPCHWAPLGIQLNQPISVHKLPKFDQGWVSVQDEAAQLAAGLLDLRPGLTVLDACAAPGGKTCHILETEPELKQLTAVELDPSRARRIEENLQRLKLNANVIVADACAADSWKPNYRFDRILVDAACSATGVIRRHPDIKLLRRREDIDKLAQRQVAMLKALWPLLQPGGLLLYATCSVLPQENEKVVEAFLAAHMNAEDATQGIAKAEGVPEIVPLTIDTTSDSLGLSVNNADTSGADNNLGIKQPLGRQLLPQLQGHDGFYYALVRKLGE